MQQQETKKPRRIQQISVTNLFGTFNHDIPLNMDERITIIHGPNGFGKTIMLKLLQGLFSSSDQLLQSYQFKTIGTWNPNDVRPDNLERSLRLAFERSYFYKT